MSRNATEKLRAYLDVSRRCFYTLRNSASITFPSIIPSGEMDVAPRALDSGLPARHTRHAVRSNAVGNAADRVHVRATCGTMEEPLMGDHWTYEARDEITGDVKSTLFTPSRTSRLRT